LASIGPEIVDDLDEHLEHLFVDDLVVLKILADHPEEILHPSPAPRVRPPVSFTQIFVECEGRFLECAVWVGKPAQGLVSVAFVAHIRTSGGSVVTDF